MVSSAELSILNNVVEIARRFGMKPSQADATVGFVSEDDDPEGKGYYLLDFVGWPTDPLASQQYGRFAALLGIEQSTVKAEHLEGLEAIVDRALSLAPRARDRTQ